jgi:hypothetical protein
MRDRLEGRRTPRSIALVPVLTLLTLAVLTALPAEARDWFPPPADGRPLFQVGIALSTLGAEGLGFEEQSLSLRGSRNLGRRWAVEGALLRFQADDVWIADLAAKLYLKDGRRADWYLSGGPSLLLLPGRSHLDTLVHLGAGTEVAIGRRLYLRPEMRFRKFLEAFNFTTLYELTLGFGWRLGG